MEQEGDNGGLYKFFQHGTSLFGWIAFQVELVYSKYTSDYGFTEFNKNNLIIAEANPKKMFKMLLHLLGNSLSKSDFGYRSNHHIAKDVQ